MVRLYIATLSVMALTGFGQMPIYNRYYLSDIPGLGWLADFYATRNVHYIGAAVLLALVFYAALDFLFMKKRKIKITGSGYLRLALLVGIVFSGGFIVIKNLPYVHFPEGLIIGVNLLHLGMAMSFLVMNLLCLVTKKRWTVGI
jgi:hypothetical protein